MHSRRSSIRFFVAVVGVLTCVTIAGCMGRWKGMGGWFQDPNRVVSPVLIPNPTSVIITDHEFAWNQLVDEVDNYFKIKKEERIRVEEGIISEGIITTHPTVGSSLLEPWRKDSTPGFEKLHATLHSLRRTCKVRVVPNGTTYLVEVIVDKEMENLVNAENSSVIEPVRSNVETRTNLDGMATPQRRNSWYSVGRDTSLEQKILANIQNRLKL